MLQNGMQTSLFIDMQTNEINFFSAGQHAYAVIVDNLMAINHAPGWHADNFIH